METFSIVGIVIFSTSLATSNRENDEKICPEIQTYPSIKNYETLMETVEVLLEEQKACRCLKQRVRELENEFQSTTVALTNKTTNEHRSKGDLPQIFQKMQLAIANITETNNELQQNIQELQQDRSSMEQTIITLNNTLEGIQTEVEQLKTGVKITADQTMVVFWGKRGISGKLGAGEAMTFNNEAISFGGGYNTTDGIFYCPVTGWYLIDLTIIPYMSNVAGADLRKNNVFYSYIWSGVGMGGTYPSGSRSVTLHLHIGDTISITGIGSYYSESCISITLIQKS